MDTFTTEPNTARSTEARGGGTCLGTDLKEAAKRFEKGLNDSKAAVSESLEESRIAAERLLKHGRYAVEDGIEETVHQISELFEIPDQAWISIWHQDRPALAEILSHLQTREELWA